MAWKGYKNLFGVNLGVFANRKILEYNFFNANISDTKENCPVWKQTEQFPMARKEGFEPSRAF